MNLKHLIEYKTEVDKVSLICVAYLALNTQFKTTTIFSIQSTNYKTLLFDQNLCFLIVFG